MEKGEFLSVGKILNFRGLNGEAKVGYTKGKDKELSELKEVWVKGIKLDIEKVRFHKQFALIKFKQINSIDELMEFKGENIYITKDEMKNSLQEDEYLISDLIGINVIDDEGDLMGVVKSVGNNGANDILCIVNEGMGKEFLVPFVQELVPIVDLNKGTIVVKVIEGLVENEI